MANIVRYVDTGSDAAGDGTTAATSSGDNTHAYQSQNQWEAAEQTDLDTANNTHTVHCNRTNGGGIDQLRCLILGWTMSATDFLTIIADDFPADGIYDNTKYLLENNDDQSDAMNIREDYVRVVNLQILVTATTGTKKGIVIEQVGVANDVRIDSCFIKGTCSGTGVGYGIQVNDNSLTAIIFNTVVTGFRSGADTQFAGIINGSCVNLYVYNCTLYNNYYGVRDAGAGTVTVINCALFNNTDDNAACTLDYCGTEQGAGEGTNGFTITQTADNYAALVVDAAGDDFDYTDESSELFETGNGATPKGTFTDDIIGTERPGVDLDWCVGAYDNVGAPVGAAGIMTTNTGFWGPTF